MIFESFDTDSRVIRLDLEGMHDSTLPSRLASLVMVACDCGIVSVECVNTDRIEGPGREAALALIERNSLFTCIDAPAGRESEADDGLWMISRDGGVLCIGDDRSPVVYSIFVPPDDGSAGKASVFAHIISCVMGFSSFVSFEVRFSVYELLNKVVTGAASGEDNTWVRLGFTRNGDTLAMTIVDRGEGFDPTERSGLRQDDACGSDRFQDIGIETTRRIADLLAYESDGKANRILFYKDRGSLHENKSESEEVKMVKFDYGTEDKDRSGIRRICLEGNLDSVGALMLEQLSADLPGEDVTGLELDFQKVSFVSSAGVGILLGLVSSMRKKGYDVSLRNVSSKVLTVFRLLNLEEYFGLETGNERVSAG